MKGSEVSAVYHAISVTMTMLIVEITQSDHVAEPFQHSVDEKRGLILTNKGPNHQLRTSFMLRIITDEKFDHDGVSYHLMFDASFYSSGISYVTRNTADYS